MDPWSMFCPSARSIFHNQYCTTVANHENKFGGKVVSDITVRCFVHHNRTLSRCPEQGINLTVILLVLKFALHDSVACSKQLGSLSTDVFEPQTATGSRMFSFLAWFCSLPWTGKLLFLYLLLDVTNAMASKRSKKGKIQLPVDVRGSKTSVLKFPNRKQRGAI